MLRVYLYAKRGAIEDSRRVFDSMEWHDHVDFKVSHSWPSNAQKTRSFRSFRTFF
uniref:Pentatricopeptide repeat-containing protein n=1 Tax=Rhizophora mucronata TaxID=61149 RepID=A0A2P2PSF3_RHIMU